MVTIVVICTVAGLLAGLFRRGWIVVMGGVTIFAIDHLLSGAYEDSGRGLLFTIANIALIGALGFPGWYVGHILRRVVRQRREDAVAVGDPLSR